MSEFKNPFHKWWNQDIPSEHDGNKMTDVYSPHLKGPQPFDPKVFLVYNAWPTTDLNGMVILWHMMLN